MDKELFKEYANVFNTTYCNLGDKYIKNSTFDVLKTADGYYIPVEKERIETSFCFPMDINGMYSKERSEWAHEQANMARTNEKYFVEENLKKLIGFMKEIESAEKVYLCRNRGNKVAYVRGGSCFDHWQTEDDKKYIARELTAEEKKEYLAILTASRASFEKRLNTYLKKYGLTKLRVWTFCSD